MKRSLSAQLARQRRALRRLARRRAQMRLTRPNAEAHAIDAPPHTQKLRTA